MCSVGTRMIKKLLVVSFVQSDGKPSAFPAIGPWVQSMVEHDSRSLSDVFTPLVCLQEIICLQPSQFTALQYVNHCPT